MKLVIQLTNGNHINLSANRLSREGDFVLAFSGHDFVAAIDLDSIEYLYLAGGADYDD